MLDVIPDFGELFSNALRSIMFFFDNIIYGFIPTIYKLFLYLSELDLFGAGSDNPLQKLVNRIYVLLGIFMLFKVSFSLLQYLVDPAAFRDSSKGMGKLVTNVLVSLVLLVSTPIIFEFAMNLQKTIVHSNAIGQLILGTNSTGMVSSDSKVTSLEMNADQVETMAKDLQFLMFGAFFSLNLNSDEVVGTSSSPGPFYSCAGTSGVLGSIDTITINDGKCLEELNTHINEYEDAADYGVDLYSFYKYYEDGQTMDDRLFIDFDRLLNWRVDHDYVFNYMPVISTAVGVYVVFLLISFSIDIAVRAIKLCFLQMVAPIAIVSYIDPKETMSNGKLYNWIKECGVTYFSLFLRIATLFFIMLLVSALCSSVLTADGSIATQFNDPDYNIWVYLFLIIGAFMFAKELPKLIESIFGIKGSGDLHLNPLKNPGVAAVAGGAIGLGIGVAGAATGSGIGRIATGTLGGFKAGLGGKKIGEIANMQADANRRLGMARSNGSTLLGRMGARVSSFLGTPGAMGRVVRTKEAIEQENQMLENYANTVNGIEDDARAKITSGEAGDLSQEYFRRAEHLNNLRQQNETRQQQLSDLQRSYANGQDLRYEFTDDDGQTTVMSISAGDVSYEDAYNQQLSSLNSAIDSTNNDIINAQIDNNDWLKSTATYDYIDGVESNVYNDAKLAGRLKDAREYADIANIAWDEKASDRHSTAGKTRGRISDNKREIFELPEKERKAKADLDAVNGKPGGTRGPRGPRFGRGPRR